MVTGCTIGNRVLLLIAMVLACLSMGSSVSAQTIVDLPKLVIQPKHTEYASTRNPGTPDIVGVRSSNPSVATAELYRVSRVQIVGVAPGRTDIEFFDNAQRVLYHLPVWVENANASGGGGAGYNPKKTQLTQVVMLPKHTHNITVPGAGAHQLSSVVSSNPSVATARTNTANTIQIYSTALGDTFIDFADNAQGKAYQVHVWVVNKLSGQAGGGGGAGGGTGPKGPIANPNPNPNPNPFPFPKKPVAGAPAGPLDSCICGTWRAVSVVNDFVHWNNGGEGVIMKIKPDGQISLDYSGAQPNHNNGKTITWGGTASGRIATNQGKIIVQSVDSSALTNVWTFPKSPTYNGKMSGLGNILQQELTQNYTCTKDTLTISSHVWKSTFKRE
jgi:hypothetical protein